MNQEASEDKGAADILRQWINQGEVAIDDKGMPNIIGNHNEMSEQPMWRDLEIQSKKSDHSPAPPRIALQPSASLIS